ncbi:MAG: hypothetical protein ACKO0M_19385 [Cyanobium sp.]
MVAVVLLMWITLVVHRLLLQPFGTGLQPLLQVPWGLWVLLLIGLWLFSGPRSRS